MSDLDALGNPEHVCGDGCQPYEPLADRNLESLDESAHIDALYTELNLVREHVALTFLGLQRDVPEFKFSTRMLAVLLDVSEVEAECLLGQGHHKVGDIVQHAVNVTGEDGYIGRAMAALFRAELMDVRLPSGDDDPE